MAPDKTSNPQTDRQTLFSSLLQSPGSSMSVWFVFLFSGGIVFAVYYARIGYLRLRLLVWSVDGGGFSSNLHPVQVS